MTDHICERKAVAYNGRMLISMETNYQYKKKTMTYMKHRKDMKRYEWYRGIQEGIKDTKDKMVRRHWKVTKGVEGMKEYKGYK